MNANDETALVEREKLAAYFIEAEGTQIVRDMARHVGDEIHEVLKRHGMTMTTAAGAIGVGVLAGVQALNDTLEFARRSVDTEGERAAIAGGVAELIQSELDTTLTAALFLTARREGVEEGNRAVRDVALNFMLAEVDDAHATQIRNGRREIAGSTVPLQSALDAICNALATRPPVAEDAVERVNVPRILPRVVREAMTTVRIEIGNGPGATSLNYEEAQQVWDAALAALAALSWSGEGK